eukprot:m.100250 g.100250  ORF g.100250 m.100250 type:complete len:69 (+) comp8923_c0_seq2:642-848(+)
MQGNVKDFRWSLQSFSKTNLILPAAPSGQHLLQMQNSMVQVLVAEAKASAAPQCSHNSAGKDAACAKP